MTARSPTPLIFNHPAETREGSTTTSHRCARFNVKDDPISLNVIEL